MIVKIFSNSTRLKISFIFLSKKNGVCFVIQNSVVFGQEGGAQIPLISFVEWPVNLRIRVALFAEGRNTVIAV